MSISELSQLGKISQKKSSKLVGLGLTTSNYIAEFLCPSPLNGLYVESSEGFGSKFLFLIENMADISFEQENKLTKLDTSNDVNRFLPQRNAVIDWIYRAQKILGFSRSTLFLAIALLDKLISFDLPPTDSNF